MPTLTDSRDSFAKCDQCGRWSRDCPSATIREAQRALSLEGWLFVIGYQGDPLRCEAICPDCLTKAMERQS